MTRAVKLTIVSDILCPFCYIGHKELQTAIAQCADLPLSFDIEYKPFRVLTSLPDDAGPVDKEAYIRAKLGDARFERTAQMLGEWSSKHSAPDAPDVSFRGKMSQSTRAHRLSLKALRSGGQEAQQKVLTLLFKAYCEQALDVGDINILGAIAERAGVMGAAEARAFLESDELKSEVDALISDVRGKGITGVPFTVIDGKWAVSGGQPADVYVQIFKKLATCTGGDTTPTSSPFPGVVVHAAA
ncbi:hypothetical protein PLICRDRAFT_52958 [Plicaturopsis crispa FD-325 SS-3]|nr:hypothetical protein PLICRDRAFT_52958 [Plicaturopsis crispa FD-325 SS-3]